MKKRTLGLIIAGVAAASMIGTGFAAWIITSNATAEKKGQFVVDTVSEKTVTITPTFASDEDTIRFVAPANATAGWLTSDNENGTENLTVTLNVAYGFSEGASAADFKVKYDIDYSAIDDAIEAGYVTAPALKLNNVAYTDNTAQALSGASEALTITFAWGSAFGGENPYDYYNELNNSETNRTNAKTALTALAGLDDATFTITITVTPASEA